MTSTPDRFERQARERWLGNAARAHYGRCEGCERVRDHDDRPLLVARQPRARRFLCFDCHEFGPPASRVEAAEVVEGAVPIASWEAL